MNFTNVVSLHNLSICHTPINLNHLTNLLLKTHSTQQVLYPNRHGLVRVFVLDGLSLCHCSTPPPPQAHNPHHLDQYPDHLLSSFTCYPTLKQRRPSYLNCEKMTPLPKKKIHTFLFLFGC